MLGDGLDKAEDTLYENANFAYMYEVRDLTTDKTEKNRRAREIDLAFDLTWKNCKSYSSSRQSNI